LRRGQPHAGDRRHIRHVFGGEGGNRGGHLLSPID
jgi:hypothetical protein